MFRKVACQELKRWPMRAHDSLVNYGHDLEYNVTATENASRLWYKTSVNLWRIYPKLTKNASTLHSQEKNWVFSTLAWSCAQGRKSHSEDIYCTGYIVNLILSTPPTLWTLVLSVCSTFDYVFLPIDFSRQVLQIIGHGNCIAAAYNHCICVFKYVEPVQIQSYLVVVVMSCMVEVVKSTNQNTVKSG